MTFCVSAAKRATVQSEQSSDIQVVVFFPCFSLSPSTGPGIKYSEGFNETDALVRSRRAFVKYAERPGVPSVTDTDEHLLDLGADVSPWRSHQARHDGRQ